MFSNIDINNFPKMGARLLHKVPQDAQMSSDMDRDLGIPGSFPSGTDHDSLSQPWVASYDDLSSGPQDMSQPMIDFAQRSRMSSLSNIPVHRNDCTHSEKGEAIIDEGMASIASGE